MSVKVLDAHKYLYGSREEAASFCQDLVDCMTTTGFVKLINHNVPDEVVKTVFGYNDQFFKLPEETKASIRHPPEANPNRGWSAIGQEKSSAITDFEKGKKEGKAVFDAKEAFDMGAPDDPLYDNMWLEEGTLPGFRSCMSSFYALCQTVHVMILRALEQGFADRGVLVDLSSRCQENVSELRLNYYPPVDVSELKDGKVGRISKHTDFGTLTLLWQDACGGLEIEDQNSPGNYFPVELESKSEVLVNIGDSLQRLTNNVLTSVSHQVTTPTGKSAGTNGKLDERYSIAYFAKVSRNQSLKPLYQFVDAANPAHYDDMTAYELNQMKLKKIYG